MARLGWEEVAVKCPKCGSDEIKAYEVAFLFLCHCLSCNNRWTRIDTDEVSVQNEDTGEWTNGELQ